MRDELQKPAKGASAKRRQIRSKMVLLVRLFVADASGKFTEQLGHTVDIARDGARVGGAGKPPQVGEMVSVQCGAVKRAFRVVWVVQTGREYQLGLQAADSACEQRQGKLPQSKDEHHVKAKAAGSST
jgi:hypothetical protein